jgi:hypothetical protein
MAEKKITCSYFVRHVDISEPGIIEFHAWKNAKWMGIWQKPHNEKTTKAHLVYVDCPGEAQITFRFLVVEGLDEVPQDENWMPLQLCWSTRRSFGTLYLNSGAKRKSDPDRGIRAARQGKPSKMMVEVDSPQEALAP